MLLIRKTGSDVKLLQTKKKMFMLGGWLVYGLIVLFTPLLVKYFLPEYSGVSKLLKEKGVDFLLGLPNVMLTFFSGILPVFITGFIQTIWQYFIWGVSGIFQVFNIIVGEFIPKVDEANGKYLVYLMLSFLIIGWLGYLTSRIWLSWYLAVSLLFDGHNNEVGGLARIEDFKHILRIKVQEEKLTVYVIGIETAEPELNKLKLKLVDKFELECSPIN